MGSAGLITYLLSPSPSITLVTFVTYSLFGLSYEFLHFLSHTRCSFKPESFLHRVKANHMRHHRVDSER